MDHMKSVTWFFTFGTGQTHPVSGERLERRFVSIFGTHYTARREMFRRFEGRWSGQYETAADRTAPAISCRR